MVKNYNEFGDIWKNIPICKEILEIMQSLPNSIKDEFDTPKDKVSVM